MKSKTDYQNMNEMPIIKQGKSFIVCHICNGKHIVGSKSYFKCHKHKCPRCNQWNKNKQICRDCNTIRQKILLIPIKENDILKLRLEIIRELLRTDLKSEEVDSHFTEYSKNCLRFKTMLLSHKMKELEYLIKERNMGVEIENENIS